MRAVDLYLELSGSHTKAGLLKGENPLIGEHHEPIFMGLWPETRPEKFAPSLWCSLAIPDKGQYGADTSSRRLERQRVIVVMEEHGLFKRVRTKNWRVGITALCLNLSFAPGSFLFERVLYCP